MSNIQIRCKNCGHWNTVISYEEECISCGDILVKQDAAELESIERRKTAGEIKLAILPEDTLFKRIGKHIYNTVTLIFLAIVSFFVWLFALGPG
jgi:hypothetical protein